jgi:hypothetical protein
VDEADEVLDEVEEVELPHALREEAAAAVQAEEEEVADEVELPGLLVAAELVDEAQLPRALRVPMAEGRERQGGDLVVGDRAFARPPGGWRRAVAVQRDVPFWSAYTYDGSLFAPRGVHPNQTISWFLCPLIADAGDLDWLFPLDLVPRPSPEDIETFGHSSLKLSRTESLSSLSSGHGG